MVKLRETLAELFWDNNRQWFNTSEASHKKDKILYHYTNIDGLMGILATKKLWMTKSDFLNDSSEIIYFESLENEILREFEKEIVNEKGAKIKEDNLYQTFISEFKKALELSFNTTRDDSIEIYVLSLSERKDSLILWGNYAKGNGFNIGFEANELLNQIKDKDDDFLIVHGSVEYNKNKQIDIIVRAMKNTFETIVKNDAETDEMIIELPIYFKSLLITYSIFFKHSTFQPEEEYRIVATIPEKAIVEFRKNQGNIIPYISPEFKKLSVREVVIGPKNNSDSTEKGILLFLERNKFNLEEINLYKSEVPLRY